jgi:hypothetical protein
MGPDFYSLEEGIFRSGSLFGEHGFRFRYLEFKKVTAFYACDPDPVIKGHPVSVPFFVLAVQSAFVIYKFSSMRFPFFH